MYIGNAAGFLNQIVAERMENVCIFGILQSDEEYAVRCVGNNTDIGCNAGKRDFPDFQIIQQSRVKPEHKQIMSGYIFTPEEIVRMAAVYSQPVDFRGGGLNFLYTMQQEE